MTTNFIQWNPNAANQESDATYAADGQRSGGATSGTIFASPLGNKVLFQLSTFITAFCNELVAKGYSPNDGSASPSTALANLQAVLAHVITSGDLAPYALTATIEAGAGFLHSANGYVKLPTWLGSIIIQWAAGAVQAPSIPGVPVVQTVNWPIAFPNSCFIAMVSMDVAGTASGTDLWYQTAGWNTSGVTVSRIYSQNDAGIVGVFANNTQPFVIGIGY